MSKEAMELALEALMRSRKAVSGDLDLAGCAYGSNDPDGHRYDDAKKALVTLEKAITALREAQQQPAPVQQEWIETACALIKAADDAAYDRDYMLDSNDCIRVLRGEWKGGFLNDCPPALQPAQRKPMTDDELADLWYKQSLDWMEFARAIEAKLKEKNT